MAEQPISDYRLIQQLEAAVAELERVVRLVAAVQVAPGHGYDLDAMDEAIIAARRVLAAGVTATPKPPPMADTIYGCDEHYYDGCPNCGRGKKPAAGVQGAPAAITEADVTAALQAACVRNIPEARKDMRRALEAVFSRGVMGAPESQRKEARDGQGN